MRVGVYLCWLLLGLVAGCGGNTPPLGTKGGPCFPNGTCNPPLGCVDNVCTLNSQEEVRPDADGGIPDGDADAGSDPGSDEGADGADEPADLPPPCRFSEPVQGPWSGLYEDIDHLQDDELRSALLELVDNHQQMGYDNAREELFSDLNNRNGYVQCVYTGEWVQTNDIPAGDVMNTEHTWCQSWGADTEPAISDLHHLFPVTAESNSKRSSYHFGDVVDASWSEGGSELGLDAAMHRVFEPRDEHKGDCARAMFYFALRYERSILDYEEDALREWNCRDLPDEAERARNDAIESLQDNRNPFVDRPDLVESIADF